MILTFIFFSTFGIIKIRRKIISKKKFLDFIEDCDSITLKIRYSSPGSDETGISSSYNALLYFKSNGIIVIPNKSFLLFPEIFLFVNYAVYFDDFPKPTIAGEIFDYRITKNVVVLKYKTNKIFNIKEYEMILEFESESKIPINMTKYLEVKDY